jgi:riboflavin transporter FmnP
MTEFLVNAVDLVEPIALIAMLASACGTLRDALKSDKASEICLGALFGTVSLLEMHAPIEPFDGLIIDLRNVPITLAGAFLGFRGLAVCLAIACAARMGIGGVGAMSGVAAMMIAGFAGFLWAQWQRERQVKRWRDYAVLCLMAATHQVAVVLLPPDLAIWFVTHATVPLIALNSICIVLVGLLLDREARMAETKHVITVARQSILKDEVLSEAELCRKVMLRRADDGPHAVAGILAIRLHYIPWIVKVWGQDAVATVLAALRERLETAARYGNMVGLTESGVLLLPLHLDELNEGDQFTSRIERGLTRSSVVLGPDEWVSVSIGLATTAFGTRQKITSLSYDLPPNAPARTHTPAPPTKQPNSATVKAPTRVAGPLQSALFTKADTLMRRRKSSAPP